MKVGIVTLGCDKNTVDTEYFAGVLDRHGIEVVAAPREPDPHQYDAVVINTCGFIEDAKVESIRAIIDWLEYKKRAAQRGRRVRVLVAGCLSQRYKEQLVSELPDVDGFMGVGEFDRVIDLVRAPADVTSQINLIEKAPSLAPRGGLARKRLDIEQAHAFIKIADGCSHNCSFCAIPQFKGKFVSIDRDILLAEARALVSRGVREINLVAQDTSDYGKDIYGRDYGIANLLTDLAAIPGDFWIRVFYFYPGGVNRAFIDAMRSSPKIVKYLDMPLQHLHPDVLRRMKRPHKSINTIELIARLRREIPGIALRTTLMTGFPGETKEEFEYMLSAVKELRFNRLGAFSYSPEEDTSAAAMREQIPTRTKRSRHEKLMRAQADISYEMNQEQIGTEKKVLVENQLEDGRYIGRSESDGPEVDGAVYLTSEQKLKPGDFVQVRITDADIYDLEGEV